MFAVANYLMKPFCFVNISITLSWRYSFGSPTIVIECRIFFGVLITISSLDVVTMFLSWFGISSDSQTTIRSPDLLVNDSTTEISYSIIAVSTVLWFSCLFSSSIAFLTTRCWCRSFDTPAFSYQTKYLTPPLLLVSLWKHLIFPFSTNP